MTKVPCSTCKYGERFKHTHGSKWYWQCNTPSNNKNSQAETSYMKCNEYVRDQVKFLKEFEEELSNKSW